MDTVSGAGWRKELGVLAPGDLAALSEELGPALGRLAGGKFLPDPDGGHRVSVAPSGRSPRGPHPLVLPIIPAALGVRIEVIVQITSPR